MSSSPVSVTERVSELDILRGFALLGVFMGMAGEYIYFGWATTIELAVGARVVN